jgi:hypothetical protein
MVLPSKAKLVLEPSLVNCEMLLRLWRSRAWTSLLLGEQTQEFMHANK